MKKAVGYLRVSSEGQKAGFGFDRQKQSIQAWARATGHRVIQWYEESISGTESDREGFSRMLSDLLSNGCRVVVVESLDRLARDVMVQSTLLAHLASKGITLFSATTAENVTESLQADPMRAAMVRIQAVFAQLEKELLVKKLRKARESKKASTGVCEGRKPFGHYAGEGDTLKRIKDLARKREGRRAGATEIARVLNAEGRQSRTGAPWSQQAITYILLREMPIWAKDSARPRGRRRTTGPEFTDTIKKADA